MQEYKGKKIKFYAREWDQEYKDIEDGTEGTITGIALELDGFENSYFDVTLETGTIIDGISGYHLELI